MGSSGAGAFVGIDEIDAGSSVLARVGQALIDLLRAVNSMITGHALQGGKRGAVRDVHPIATQIHKQLLYSCPWGYHKPQKGPNAALIALTLPHGTA